MTLAEKKKYEMLKYKADMMSESLFKFIRGVILANRTDEFSEELELFKLSRQEGFIKHNTPSSRIHDEILDEIAKRLGDI